MNKIIAFVVALASIISNLFGRNKRQEQVQLIQDKQQEINLQSQVEEIVKSAQSKDEKTKQDALDALRLLVSE